MEHYLRPAGGGRCWRPLGAQPLCLPLAGQWIPDEITRKYSALSGLVRVIAVDRCEIIDVRLQTQLVRWSSRRSRGMSPLEGMELAHLNNNIHDLRSSCTRRMFPRDTLCTVNCILYYRKSIKLFLMCLQSSCFALKQSFKTHSTCIYIYI